MNLYTVNNNERNRNAFIVDCGCYRKNFFAVVCEDIQSFYRGELTFEELERLYFAELDARHSNDPAYVDQLLKQKLVWLTDQAPEKFIRRRQTPRYLAVSWLMTRFRIAYQGDW